MEKIDYCHNAKKPIIFEPKYFSNFYKAYIASSKTFGSLYLLKSSNAILSSISEVKLFNNV